MAITITQDLPFQPYPAYNDSYVRFNSDISPNRAELEFFPKSIFPNNFVLYPDQFGRFLFNFKEAAKADFSVQEFRHDGVTNFDWGRSFLGNLTNVSCTIRTFSDTTSDSLGINYQFSKSVRQVGEEIHDQYILSPQSDPITYYLEYWEGFPFDFQIQNVAANDEITIKNRNTGITSEAMTAQITGGFAIYLDKVDTNFTNSGFLPLTETVNRLEVYEEGAFKCNVNIKKNTTCNGVYLRWFNDQGGISYHLFDEFYRNEISSRSIDEIASNSFNNVGELVNPIKSLGRNANVTYRLKTTVGREQAKVLRQIMTSPRVEMYTSQTAYIDGEWMDIQLDTRTFRIDTKKSNQEITLQIELPERNTLTL